MLAGVFVTTGMLGIKNANAAPRIDGEDVNACQWPQVVQVHGELGRCTGVIVHPTLIVTAAHCLARDLKRVEFGEESGVAELQRTITRCAPHPKWDELGVHKGVDLAYCLLETPVDNLPYAPILAGCEKDVLQSADTPYWGVGFGQSSAETADERKRAANSLQIQLSDDIASLAWIDSDQGQYFCRGDSGAGIFVQLDPTAYQGDDSLRLVGLVSSGPAGCDGPAELSLMHEFVQFIESDSGVDVTPCFSDDEVWDPGTDCRGFLRQPALGEAAWSQSCNELPHSESALPCGNEADSIAPSVEIIEPQPDATYELGEAILVRAEVSDNFAVDSAHLEVDGVEVGDVRRHAPWQWSWESEQEGVFQIVVQAADASGLTQASKAQAVHIVAGDDDSGSTSSDSDSTDSDTTASSGEDDSNEDETGESEDETSDATDSDGDSDSDLSNDSQNDPEQQEPGSASCSCAHSRGNWSFCLTSFAFILGVRRIRRRGSKRD